MQIVYRGDAVCNFMRITNPKEIAVQFLAVQVGKVCKEYSMPTFPLQIDLHEDDTEQLELGTNVVNVAMWDSCGKKTSPTSPRFVVKEKKVICGD